MRVTTEFPDGGPDPVQPEQLAPSELGGYLPGAGVSADAYLANRNPAGADALLDGAEDRAAHLERTILAAHDQALQPALATATQLSAAVTGPVDSMLTVREAQAGKMLTKMVGQADLHTSNAEANASAFGYRTPTPAEAATSLQLANTNDSTTGGTGADTTFGGGGLDTLAGGGGSCPTFRTNSDWAQWVIQNHIGVYGDMVACLPRNAGGWPIAPEGQIIVNEAGMCPDGYVLDELGCQTPLRCCVLGSTAGGGDTLKGGSCPDGPTWDPLPANFAAATNGIYFGIQGYGVFQNLDDTAPAGTYWHVQINYHDAINDRVSFVQGWQKAQWYLATYEGKLWYWEANPSFGVGVTCWEILEARTVSGSGTGGTGGDGGSCPLPIGLACGAGKPLTWPALPPLGDGECVDWNAWVQELLKWDPTNGGHPIVNQPGNLAGTISSELSKLLYGGTQPLLPTFINWGHKQLVNLVTQLTTASGCNAVGVTETAAFAGIVNFIQKWTDIVPPVLTATLEQAQNEFCPYNLPEQSAADASWLSDTIDDDTWNCWTRSAGNLTTPAALVREAGRTRPNAAEVCLLYRRGLLDDQQFSTRLREVGVINDTEGQNIYDLTAFLPSPIDVVRFMVRDVGDPAMVAKFGLDAKFDDKIKGNIVQYAKAAGVDEETLLDFWRAHWVIPAFTQLSEMMFRNRPGRVPAAIEVTEDDVRQALNHNDVLPFWVDRLMHVSRPVLNRTDLLLAFTERTISDQEFTDGLQDLGYTPENAKRFLATYTRQRKLRDARAAGLPTAKRLVKMYADGLITTQELHDQAFEITVSRKQRQMLLDQADQARVWAQRTCTVNAIKRQYVSGLVGDADASAALAKAEIEANEIPELLKCWGPAKQTRGKVPGGSQLCKWRSQGLLTAAQQQAALVRMGWAAPDAARITQSCSLDNAAKAAKSAEAAARRAAADARKAPSKIKAAESAEQAELNREAKADIHYTEHKKTTKKTTKPPEPDGAPAGEVTQVVDQTTEDLP